LAGLALVGAAGCARDPPDRTDEAPSPPSGTETIRPPTYAETTAEPTDGPDDRLAATPPGDPPLDPAGSWPQYRFDAGNTGYDPDGTGLRDATRYWALDAGGTPSVAAGTMYNLHAREEPAALTRRAPSTAAVRSRTPLVDYGVNAPPAVAGDRAFVTTFVEAFCLAADRDEVLWRGPPMPGIQGAPTVAADAVVVNGGGFTETRPRLVAFDGGGAERWTYEPSADSNSTPAVGDGAVFVATAEDVRAVELGTGEERFATDAVRDEWASLAVADGTAYVVGYEDGETRRLVALDAADGSVRWRAGGKSTRGPPVLADGVVYSSTADGTLVGLDAEDGSEAVTFGRRAEPVCRRGKVLYARREGTLSAFDATTGEALWSYSTPRVRVGDVTYRGVTGVTPLDGAVYVAAADGLHGLGPMRE
jgi:outer membrane protein assembly factor BamB